MSFSRTILMTILAVSTLVVLNGCTDSGTDNTFEYLPIYGDGSPDKTEIIAQVGDVSITQKMLDLRFAEMPPKLKGRFRTEEGKRVLLNIMIDETIMVLGAVNEELYNDPEVGSVLLAQRRITLDSAMRNVGLLKDKEPTEDEIRAYFLANKDKFRRLDASKGRHVECLTRDDADKAYMRLVRGGANNNWPHVVNDLSHNEETKKLAGEFGWFNEGSFLPQMMDAEAFTSIAIGFDVGLHEPVLVGNRWHVIEILKKEYARTMTFSEGKAQAKMEMMGGFQDAIIKNYLSQGRKDLNVTLMGEFAPGRGMTAGQIFERAMLIADDVEKIDMLSVIFEDFPGDDRADDALFWAGSTALDAWSDRSIGRRYLEILLKDYPQSELVDQAQFLLDNMNNPKVTAPLSIEELRRNLK